VQVTGTRVAILQIEGSVEPLRRLLAGARSLGETLGILNLPVGHPAAVALKGLGARVVVRQLEMCLAL
jgi:hypothetical protein